MKTKLMIVALSAGLVFAGTAKVSMEKAALVSSKGKVDLVVESEKDVYGIGSYNHAALPVLANDLLDHKVADISPSIKSFTPEHFELGMIDAGNLIPTLKNIDLTYKINGIFSFTIDGFPILGEWPQVKGFWSAEAVWITHAGGVGKIMAQWLAYGDPGIDTHEMDVSRFHPHNMDKNYIDIRV